METTRSTTLRGNSLALLGPELKPGDKAPDFSCVDGSMQTVTLKDTSGKVRVFSVVPSLDTPVCDAQTHRFDREAASLPDVAMYTISMDLPFAQKRFCTEKGVERLKMLSDHRDASFGAHYGTLIPDLRIESRAIFVLDQDDTIRHAEYVGEVGEHPDYEAVLGTVRQLTQKANG